jgi:DNA polymerase III epsilon subunit-like protein
MLTSLTRPLVFLDLETTSNVVKDARIVQLSLKKYQSSGESEALMNEYVNPVVPIIEAATKVHGINK